jgi:hypothetical protein
VANEMQSPAYMKYNQGTLMQRMARETRSFNCLKKIPEVSQKRGLAFVPSEEYLSPGWARDAKFRAYIYKQPPMGALFFQGYIQLVIQ